MIFNSMNNRNSLESELEAYRNSELFKVTWAQAKLWFGGKPRAFSMMEEMVVDAKRPDTLIAVIRRLP